MKWKLQQVRFKGIIIIIIKTPPPNGVKSKIGQPKYNLT